MLGARFVVFAASLVLMALVVGGSPAGAAQPECKAINQTQHLAYTSLAIAISQAVANDTIKVIGVCEGNFVIDKNLSLTGRPSERHADTILGTAEDTRVLTLLADVRVANLTIATSSYGGGILNTGTLTLEDSTVSGHAAFMGAGIFNTGTMTIGRSSIVGNIVNTWGAGIYNTGTVTIEDSKIGDNPQCACNGNGIHNNGGTMTLTNTVVENNGLSLQGGGLTNANGGAMTLNRSIVRGNSAWYGGGGISNYSYSLPSSTLTITDSTVTDNHSSPYPGGGILNTGTAILTLNNSIVTGNTPDDILNQP